VTPYVVEVDKLGEVQAVGPAERDRTPADAEIAWQRHEPLPRRAR